LLLLSGVVGILIAYKMTPKEARRMQETLNDHPQPVMLFNNPPETTLRYNLDDEFVRIYAKGKLYIYPINIIVSLEIDP
jgi:hypothetical protein